MAFIGEKVYQVNLDNRAAIDTPLIEIQGAIGNAIGQDVVLGIQHGGDTRFD